MKKGFIITISKKGISLTEKAKYIKSICATKGTVIKFNNAIGFKPVSCYSEHPAMLTPDSYTPPMYLIFKDMIMRNSNDEILEFFIPFGYQEFNEWSYCQGKMAEKFSIFLKKVYPELTISLTVGYEPEATAFEQIQSLFFINSALAGKYNVFSEISCERLLTDKEINEICDLIFKGTGHKVNLDQFFCEICKSYNENAPYHILIEEA